MAAGMLSGLFSPQYKDLRAEDQDQNQLLQNLALMNPSQAEAYTAYSGGALAGKGLGQLAGAATGTDIRSPAQRQSDAVEAAKAQVAKLGFSPDDPKSMDDFYKRVIQILAGQGLSAEAMDVAREYHTQKLGDQKLELENTKLQQAAARDQAKRDYQTKYLQILKDRGVPEFAKYMTMLDATEDPTQRQMLTDRLNMMLGKTGKGIKVADAGDHLVILDAASGKPIGDDIQVGAKPMNEAAQAKQDAADNMAITKYETDKNALQHTYDAAVALYNNPGLKGAVGVWAGLASQTTPDNAGSFLNIINRARMPENVSGAVADMRQVQGQVFISALTDLKSSSKNGASGLGQLTEVEGSKIQSAKAALDPQQGYDTYRAHLAQYIQQIEQSSKIIDDAASRAGLGITIKPLQTKPLVTNPTSAPAGRRGAPAPQPQYSPSPAPAAEPKTAPGGMWGPVRKVR